MHPGPAPADPGRDGDPARLVPGPDGFPEDGVGGWRLVPSSPDWPEGEAWAGYQAALAGEDDPGDPDLEQDPDNSPPPGLDDAQLAALIAEAREVTADVARAEAVMARLDTTGAVAAAGASVLGRRGPGLPGSAQTFPGEYSSPAAGFAAGKPLDAAPGCAALGLFAEEAAGDDDQCTGASDDEVLGLICAWDRVESHASARKHAAAAELIRRRPAPGCALEGAARMPEAWDEFTSAELAPALACSRGAAETMLDLAWILEVRLPGTKGAFRSGVLREDKVWIIARATEVLDPAEARAAERLVLDRAGTLTPGGLRSAIARAVMEVAPEKARRRREEAARHARVERWAEDSGNAALVGRELPPAEVLAADQRVTWWARQLKKAGLTGTMDELRARAYLDILLDMDSRPGQVPGTGRDRDPSRDRDPGLDAGDEPGARADGAGGEGTGGGGRGGGTGGLGGGGSGPGSDADGARETGTPGGPQAGAVPGAVPAGFAGRVNLTLPLVTLLELAGRPGELAGIGPIDPALARDLARAAARNPRSTWCVTVTDQHGRAIGHGCARPEPKALPAKRDKPGAPGSHDSPRGVSSDPRFAFTADDEDGPPGGYGTWRLSAGIPGQRDLLIAVEPLPTGDCDHRNQAKGHDPGVLLRHLTQIRHATCTGPTCRRPAVQCDFEHDIPYEAGGRTCMCNGDPKCRHDHRVKQDPRWTVDLLADGGVRWTTPTGRQYTTEPTRYPI